MKKLLILAVLAGGGYYAWQRFAKPEHHSCSHIASLCELSEDQLASCESSLAKITRSAGTESGRQLHSCISEAQTCAESTGCVAGAGLAAAGHAVGDFFKGLSNALKH